MATDKQVEAALAIMDEPMSMHVSRASRMKAALEAAEAAAWEAIESAPKDGTGFLAYHAIEAGRYWAFLSCYWTDGDVGLGWYTVDLFDARNERLVTPTHWRHLPQPPKETT